MVEELAELAPEAGEEDALAERRQRLMQLEKAADEVRDADEILSGPTAPAPALAGLMRRLMRKADSGAARVPAADRGARRERSTRSTAPTEAVETLKREMAFDPAELEQVESRLFALRAAARKHHVHRRRTGRRCWRNIAPSSRRCRAARRRWPSSRPMSTAAREAYRKAARKLSAGRVKAAKALSKAVEAELPDLKLGAAKFIVDQQVDETRVAATGFDQIAFHVQTNPGTLPGPLMKVASGGELSRFLLALKVVLADRGSAPVLIFDEIDTGVGGAVADAIGRRLKRLSTQGAGADGHARAAGGGARRRAPVHREAGDRGGRVRAHPCPAARWRARARKRSRACWPAPRSPTEARAAAGKLLSDVA